VIAEEFDLDVEIALRRGHLHGFGQVVVGFRQELLAPPEEDALLLAARGLRGRAGRGGAGRRAGRRGAARAGGGLRRIGGAAAATRGEDGGRGARRDTPQKTAT